MNYLQYCFGALLNVDFLVVISVPIHIITFTCIVLMQIETMHNLYAVP